jgi:hypothetical protein
MWRWRPTSLYGTRHTNIVVLDSRHGALNRAGLGEIEGEALFQSQVNEEDFEGVAGTDLEKSSATMSWKRSIDMITVHKTGSGSFASYSTLIDVIIAR